MSADETTVPSTTKSEHIDAKATKTAPEKESSSNSHEVTNSPSSLTLRHSNKHIKPSKLGRKGDPRMHRAVSIRLANPEISLLAALRAGGFNFPEGEEGELQGTVVDSDDVQLTQRKNQLNRRLRFARQGMKKGASIESAAKEAISDDTSAGKDRGSDADRKRRKSDGNGMKTGKKRKKRDGEASHAAHLVQPARPDGSASTTMTQAQMLTQHSVDCQNTPNGQGTDDEVHDIGVKGLGLPPPLRQIIPGHGVLPGPPAATRCRGRSDESSISILSVSGKDDWEFLNEEDEDMEDETALLATRRRARNHPLFGDSGTGGQGQTGDRQGARLGNKKGNNCQAESQSALQSDAQSSTREVTTTNNTRDAEEQMSQAVDDPKKLNDAKAARVQEGNSERMQKNLAADFFWKFQLMYQAQAQLALNAHVACLGMGGEGMGTATSITPEVAFGVTAASLGMSREQLVRLLSSGALGHMMCSASAQTNKISGKSSGDKETEVENKALPSEGMSRAGVESGTSTALLSSGDKSQKDDKMKTALDLYQSECTLMMKRCMLLAGFKLDETHECEAAFMDFSCAALQIDTARVKKFRNAFRQRGCSVQSDETGGTLTFSVPNTAVINCGAMERPVTENCGTHCAEDTAKNWEQVGGGTGHDHHQPCGGEAERKAQLTADGKSTVDGESRSGCFNGRHVHQLEGKCGHKAIIHKPEGGPAHIDFLVDGKVECYQDMKPANSLMALWPSRYNCDELSCLYEPGHEDHSKVLCGEQQCKNKCRDAKKMDSKVFCISDVNLNDKEWNADILEEKGDETLLGLMKLCDTDE